MELIEKFFKFINIITFIDIKVIIRLNKHFIAMNLMLINIILLILIIKFRYNAFFYFIKGKVFNLVSFDINISDIWAYNLILLFIIFRSCFIKLSLLILPKLTIT